MVLIVLNLVDRFSVGSKESRLQDFPVQWSHSFSTMANSVEVIGMIGEGDQCVSNVLIFHFLS